MNKLYELKAIEVDLITDLLEANIVEHTEYGHSILVRNLQKIKNKLEIQRNQE